MSSFAYNPEGQPDPEPIQSNPVPQQAQQPNIPAPPQQTDPEDQNINQLRQNLFDKIQRYSTPPPQGGTVKKLLSNFIHGMGQGMMKQAGLPTDDEEVQGATKTLNQIDQTQGTIDYHKQVVDELRQRSAQVLQGKMAQVQASQANAQTAAQSRLGVANINANANPIRRVLSEAQQAFDSGDQDGYQKKLAELSQLQGAASSQARADKLSMFHQTQAYQTWKTNQDNQTKLQVAQLTAGKAPASIMQTALFAQSGLNRLNDAKEALAGLEQRGVLGGVASNKIEDWVFGKGLVDPSLSQQDREDIGRLRAALTYTSSAAMRAHTGRSSREIYDDFKNTMGLGQSSEALKGAIQETGSMLNDYATGASDASIRSLRSGGGSGGSLTADEARGYLAKAGGDKNKARALAKADGRTF